MVEFIVCVIVSAHMQSFTSLTQRICAAGQHHAPPVFMKYSVTSKLPCYHGCIHHSIFGLKMKEKCDKLGFETYIQLEDRPEESQLEWNGNAYKNEVEFVLDKLGMTV